MNRILLFSLICFCLFININAQDKVIKKDVTPSQEEQEKLKNADPKSATYPTIKNFKKELKALPAFKKKYIPTPIAYADPNIGFSFGAGVGAIFYDQDDRIRHLIAPYFHYNQNTEEGITGRYIFMPTEKERYYYKISKSEIVDEEYLFEYINKKFYLDKFSFSALGDIFQDGTARFYGKGRHTKKGDRLNYDHSEKTFQLKGGYIVNQYADINLKLEYLNVDVKKGADKKIDQVIDVYSEDPLIRKSSFFSGALDIGFNLLGDSDERLESFRLEVWGKESLGLSQYSNDFLSWGLRTKWFKQINPNWSIAGSLFYQDVIGDDLPFYILSTLGGSRSCRGYELGRYYDNSLISGMTELRWKFYQLNKFGFTTDWELAMFYDYGQVGEDSNDFAFENLQHSGGIGIRTHFGAGLLTRIDVGYGNEGFKIFVDFGYPF